MRLYPSSPYVADYLYVGSFDKYDIYRCTNEGVDLKSYFVVWDNSHSFRSLYSRPLPPPEIVSICKLHLALST